MDKSVKSFAYRVVSVLLSVLILMSASVAGLISTNAIESSEINAKDGSRLLTVITSGVDRAFGYWFEDDSANGFVTDENPKTNGTETFWNFVIPNSATQVTITAEDHWGENPDNSDIKLTEDLAIDNKLSDHVVINLSKSETALSDFSKTTLKVSKQKDPIVVKKGNSIDKLACSEFWKAKDSYRQLQNAFYDYMTSHNFKLERGIPIEESGRKHLDLKEYKDITNFDKTKEKLQNIKLELPDVPNLEDINVSRWSKKRDEKILEEIIKPKDKVINELYQDNIILRQELLRKSKMFEKAEKYQIERNGIIEDNAKLHNEVEQIKAEYKQKEFDIEWKYKSKIKGLEKENNHLHNVVDKFKETIKNFIHWICKKFDMGAEDYLIRDFQKETNTLLDAEKQIAKEKKEKEWDLEL